MALHTVPGAAVDERLAWPLAQLAAEACDEAFGA